MLLESVPASFFPVHSFVFCRLHDLWEALPEEEGFLLPLQQKQLLRCQGLTGQR